MIYVVVVQLDPVLVKFEGQGCRSETQSFMAQDEIWLWMQSIA